MQVELEFLTDAEKLQMVENGIRDKICHVVHKYPKANNKYMKDYDPSTELSYLVCWNVSNLYEWVMSQKLSVDGFKWKKKSRFSEVYIHPKR